MSYDPSVIGLTEFLWAYNTSSQNLPTRTTTGGVTNTSYNTTITMNSYRSSNTGASLSSSELNTNNALALWCGDMRSHSGTSRRNRFCIEMEDNKLTRNAASQDEGLAACRDDVCYSVSDKARIKIKIVYRIDGSTTAPFSRILGMVIKQ